MKVAVLAMAGALLGLVVPASDAPGDIDLAALSPVPPPLYPMGSAEYEANVVAWTRYILQETGGDEVPEEYRGTIKMASHYSAPLAAQADQQAPLDNVAPYSVHVGYMYFECDDVLHGGCFVEDWWGNMEGVCGGWYVNDAYEQMDAKLTMAEWGGGWVKTFTEAYAGVHFSSRLDGAVLNGYLCTGPLPNGIAAAFSGWGIFDHPLPVIDPVPTPWSVVPVEVPPPPPPYDDLGPPFCPGFCWEPEDLLPQPPGGGLTLR